MFIQVGPRNRGVNCFLKISLAKKYRNEFQEFRKKFKMFRGPKCQGTTGQQYLVNFALFYIYTQKKKSTLITFWIASFKQIWPIAIMNSFVVCQTHNARYILGNSIFTSSVVISAFSHVKDTKGIVAMPAIPQSNH